MDSRRLLALTLFVTALASPAAWSQTAELPDGKGKDTVQKVCTGCHELDLVVASRRTEIGWQGDVQDMISRGAEASEREVAEVVAYLTRYFGKLNVNTGSVQQLQDVLELPDKEAQAIVAYRDRKGKIKDFEELKSVPGVSADKLQEKRSLVAFTQ